MPEALTLFGHPHILKLDASWLKSIFFPSILHDTIIWITAVDNVQKYLGYTFKSIFWYSKVERLRVSLQRYRQSCLPANVASQWLSKCREDKFLPISKEANPSESKMLSEHFQLTLAIWLGELLWSCSCIYLYLSICPQLIQIATPPTNLYFWFKLIQLWNLTMWQWWPSHGPSGVFRNFEPEARCGPWGPSCGITPNASPPTTFSAQCWYLVIMMV